MPYDTTQYDTGQYDAPLVKAPNLTDFSFPSQGWYVEIVHPDSGRVLRPPIKEGSQFRPVINALPAADIHVEKNTKWQDSSFERAELRAWEDGDRLPLEELSNVEHRADRTVLSARGGVEALTRVTDYFDEVPCHTAAQTLLNTNTSYPRNIDDPNSFVQTKQNEQFQSASGADLDTILRSSAETDPWEINSNGLETLQTLFFFEAESPDSSTDLSTTTAQSGDSNDTSAFVNAGDQPGTATYNFTVPYTLVSDDVAVKIRGNLSPTDDEWTVSINGDIVATVSGDTDTNDYEWIDPVAVANGSGYGGSDLQSGQTYDIQLTIGSATNSTRPLFDAVAVYDSGGRYSSTDHGAFSYNFADTLDADDHLPGPELYPDDIHVESSDVATAFIFDEATISATLDDTSGKQSLGISRDEGQTWTETQNTQSHTVDFQQTNTVRVRWRASIGRAGTTRDTQSPTTGFESQTLSDATLTADITEVPILHNQQYDGRLVDVLQDIADYGDFVFEFNSPPNNREPIVVEWTKPGQRTATHDDAIDDFTVSKDVERQYKKAVIKGASQTVEGEEFDADAGNPANLTRSNLVEGKEFVYNPGPNTGFERIEDYEIDYENGQITVQGDGAMVDGDTYEISYQWTPQNSFAASDFDSSTDQTFVETIPPLSTDRGCLQAATTIVREASDPLWTARLTIDRVQAGRSLVDDIQFEGLPTDGNRVVVKNIETTPGQVIIETRNRRTANEVASTLTRRLQGTSRKV